MDTVLFNVQKPTNARTTIVLTWKLNIQANDSLKSLLLAFHAC